MAAFPHHAHAQAAHTPALRGLVRESALRSDRLVAPLFVSETATAREPVEAMPGVDRLPLAEVVARHARLPRSASAAVLLFGVPRREGRARARRHGMRRAACSWRCARSSGRCRDCW